MQGGATLPCAPPFHAALPPPCPARARIEPERHPAPVEGAYADFRYVDVMFPPPGADRCAWERIDAGDLARRVAACGARPGFATVQRFRSPAPLEDEPRLTGLYFDFDDKENPERALADAARLVRWFAETGLPWSAFRIEFSGSGGPGGRGARCGLRSRRPRRRRRGRRRARRRGEVMARSPWRWRDGLVIFWGLWEMVYAFRQVCRSPSLPRVEEVALLAAKATARASTFRIRSLPASLPGT